MKTSTISEELLKRVQSIINELPLIILGSGASVAYGIPSMSELGKCLRQNIKLTTKDDLEQFDRFKSNLDATHDIEQALSNLTLNENVLTAIIKQTWECINAADLKVYESFLHDKKFPLSELIAHLIGTTKKQISIITTNYDRLIEYASSLANALICNGYTQNYFGCFSVETETNNGLGYSGRVKIWKVHGSLDWFRDEN